MNDIDKNVNINNCNNDNENLKVKSPITQKLYKSPKTQNNNKISSTHSIIFKHKEIKLNFD